MGASQFTGQQCQLELSFVSWVVVGGNCFISFRGEGGREGGGNLLKLSGGEISCWKSKYADFGWGV